MTFDLLHREVATKTTWNETRTWTCLRAGLASYVESLRSEAVAERRVFSESGDEDEFVVQRCAKESQRSQRVHVQRISRGCSKNCSLTTACFVRKACLQLPTTPFLPLYGESFKLWSFYFLNPFDLSRRPKALAPQSIAKRRSPFSSSGPALIVWGKVWKKRLEGVDDVDGRMMGGWVGPLESQILRQEASLAVPRPSGLSWCFYFVWWNKCLWPYGEWPYEVCVLMGLGSFGCLLWEVNVLLTSVRIYRAILQFWWRVEPPLSVKQKVVSGKRGHSEVSSFFFIRDLTMKPHLKLQSSSILAKDRVTHPKPT